MPIAPKKFNPNLRGHPGAWAGALRYVGHFRIGGQWVPTHSLRSLRRRLFFILSFSSPDSCSTDCATEAATCALAFRCWQCFLNQTEGGKRRHFDWKSAGRIVKQKLESYAQVTVVHCICIARLDCNANAMQIGRTVVHAPDEERTHCRPREDRTDT